MRSELVKYFSDKQNTAGLLVAEAPTGYGKTYEAVQAIYRYVRNGGDSQILFVTNLLKNLPVDELRKVYEKDGRGPEFEKEVLILKSTAATVEQAILQEKIPTDFQTDAYWALLRACEQKQKYRKAGPEVIRIFDDDIRTKLEPAFRHELETHLRKNFREGPARRRDAIRRQKQYQWMAKFYPAVFWADYKVVLMSVQKLMARNVTLVERSYEFLSERVLEKEIVCIDEFDASRAVILDCLIERALELRADYLHLFLQVYRGIMTHKASNDLTRLRAKYESGRRFTWEDMVKQAQEIYEDGALEYCMKTIDADIDRGRYFLFHDTSYHTVLDGNRTHIRAVRDDERAQVQIKFETKAVYDARRDEPHIVLQSLLRRIHVFLRRFQRYVYGWGTVYSQYVNAGKKEDEELYPIAAAVETIFHEYGLTPEQTRLMIGEIDSNGAAAHNVVAPDLSFYETGFRLFEFIDDDCHRTQTHLQYLQMENTPEKILLSLCRRAKVVGLSATAALPTVLGNYDLTYLREQLQNQYLELSVGVKNKIRQELESVWSPYERGQVRVDLQVVDRNCAHLMLSERLNKVFSRPENIRKYELRMTHMGIRDYDQKRYCNIFAAMKAFWAHSEIHSFLCLNQMLPAAGKRAMDTNLLVDVLEDLRLETAPQSSGGLVVLRSGEQFETDKEILLQALKEGEKRFILSTYQTLGAGQNLQYAVADREGLVLLTPKEPNEQDSRFWHKDVDALFLGDVNHVTVNLNDEGSLSNKDMLKFCFQAECLYQNDEISYGTLNALLKDGIGRFSGRRQLNSMAQSMLRHTASVYRQITRDVIQAVGRMGRTFLKRPVIYLFTTEKLLRDLDQNCLKSRFLSPEMQAISSALVELTQEAVQADSVRNEAERKATRGNAYIMRMLNSGWTAETMTLWKALRYTVLSHPRASADLTEIDPVIRTYYIPIDKEKRSYFYAQKGDFSEVVLSMDQDKTVFGLRLPNGMYPSEVSEEEARLSAILSYPGMKAYFESSGWATEFGDGEYIFSPVLFQNIYKGALGEVAGRFILRQELGLELSEIEDPTHFETFDFVLGNNIYFDFKHWKPNTQMDETVMRSEILTKLNSVGGKCVFVINLISDRLSESSCTSDRRLIEIPGLLLPDGQVNQNVLNYMRRCLFDPYE